MKVSKILKAGLLKPKGFNQLSVNIKQTFFTSLI